MTGEERPRPHIYVIGLGGLSIMVIRGRLRLGVKDITEALKSRMDVDLVYGRRDSDYVNGMCFSPIIDVGINDTGRNKSFLRISGTDDDVSIDRILEIGRIIGMDGNTTYDSRFYRTFARVEERLLRRSYPGVLNFMRTFSVPMDRALGAIVYREFLMEEKGYNEERAVAESCKKFGLKLK